MLPINPQVASAAAKALEQQAQVPAGPGTAKEADVARFEDLMAEKAPQVEKPPGPQGQAVNSTGQPGAVQGTGQPTPAPNTGGPVEPGVVDRLQRTSEELKVARQEILDRLATTADLSPKQLLEMQMKLAELTMQQTLIGKAGEKSEQAVQTLFRG